MTFANAHKPTAMTTAELWQAARLEAMFKRTEGEFLFRVPVSFTLSLLPRHYLVTEAQKIELQSIMRSTAKPVQSSRFAELKIVAAIFLAAVVVVSFLLLCFALESAVESSLIRTFGSRLSDLSALIFMLLFLCLYYAAVLGLLRFPRLKRIGRALEGARYTEERITRRERDITLVRSLPLSTLVGAAILKALSGGLFSMIFLLEGKPLTGWFIVAGFGGYAIRYLYLTLLKLSLERQREPAAPPILN
jgi:hypothetical protein